MNKDNTRSAAGLRRSAIVERLRLREEWSALKGATNETKGRPNPKCARNKNTNTTEIPKQIDEVLRGVVVLVEIGSESRALALRAALSALGASVVPAWSPFVTHLVWTQGGCRNIRSKARAMACRLVSPLWVEACAAEGRKLSEKIFPAPARPSDLPSPATLRRFLKRAEKENIPLHNLLSDSAEGDIQALRLRLSSDTDKSHDTSKDISPDIATRVNTAPRRPRPAPTTPNKAVKSKRKLFTQKEVHTTDDENDTPTPAGPKKMPHKMTQRNRKDLAVAERMAKALMGTAPSKTNTQSNKQTIMSQYQKSPKIVLTGMTNKERKQTWQLVQRLNGKVQRYVDKRTTHVVMGSCHEPPPSSTRNTTIATITSKSPENTINTPSAVCHKCNSPVSLLSRLLTTKIAVVDNSRNDNVNNESVDCSCRNNDISGVDRILDTSSVDDLVFPVELRRDYDDDDNNAVCPLGSTETENILQRHRKRAQSTSILDGDINDPQSNDALGSHRDCAQSNNIIHGDRGYVQNSDVSSCDRDRAQSSDILRGNRDCVQSSGILNRDRKSEQSNDTLRHDRESASINDNNRINIQSNDILNPDVENSQSNDILYLDEDNENNDRNSNVKNAVKNTKPRTLNALLGAARGCRVLHSEWVKDSLRENRWLSHMGYEVRHLRKISRKASVERSALNKMRTDYAYNVFNGIRVKISSSAEQIDAITQLLNLCGAVITDGSQNKLETTQTDIHTKKTRNKPKITFKQLIGRTQNLQQDGGQRKQTQNGRRFGAKTQNCALTQDGAAADADIIIGMGNGEINSQWVFDSVAAARMRTTRRYFNKN